ncbi:MAG: phage major capsid protein [Deltaproteobacteria bacterium]|nr:phage major capsid protein [Deltaproteobacteria bacterium]
MSQLQELKAEFRETSDKMQKMLDTCKSEGRDLTIEEEGEYENFEARLDEIKGQISLIEKSRNLTAVTDGNFSTYEKMTKGVVPGRSWEQIHRDLREVPTCGFKSLGEFLQQIASGRVDDRLARLDCRGEFRASTIEGTAGGYITPTAFTKEIYSLLLEDSICLPRVRVYPSEQKSRDIPMWDMTDRSGGTIGGFEIKWSGEGSARTAQDPEFKLRSMSAKTCDIFCAPTLELIKSSDFGEIIGPMLAKVMAFGLDSVIIGGSGIGRPKGFLSANCFCRSR